MISPQNLKARQEKTIFWLRVQGLVLTLILILVGASEVVDARINGSQDRCVKGQITDLTEVFEARGEINEREAKATADLISAVAKARETSPADVDQAFIDYTTEAEKIKELRENNPVPSFPTGSCS